MYASTDLEPKCTVPSPNVFAAWIPSRSGEAPFDRLLASPLCTLPVSSTDPWLSSALSSPTRRFVIVFSISLNLFRTLSHSSRAIDTRPTLFPTLPPLLPPGAPPPSAIRFEAACSCFIRIEFPSSTCSAPGTAPEAAGTDALAGLSRNDREPPAPALVLPEAAAVRFFMGRSYEQRSAWSRLTHPSQGRFRSHFTFRAWHG